MPSKDLEICILIYRSSLRRPSLGMSVYSRKNQWHSRQAHARHLPGLFVCRLWFIVRDYYAYHRPIGGLYQGVSQTKVVSPP